jgi:hypothetical protein
MSQSQPEVGPSTAPVVVIDEFAVQPRVITAVDIEAGDEWTPVAIGLYSGDSAGKRIAKRQFSLPVPDGWEPKGRCKTEFWDKQPGLWEKLRKNVDPDALRKFVDVWDAQEMKDIASDNPAFDIGILDHAIREANLREFPLRYTREGKYRSITDAGESLWTLGLKDIVDDRIEKWAPHDHNPENDAEAIYWKHIVADLLRKKIVIEGALESYMDREVSEAVSEQLQAHTKLIRETLAVKHEKVADLRDAIIDALEKFPELRPRTPAGEIMKATIGAVLDEVEEMAAKRPKVGEE